MGVLNVSRTDPNSFDKIAKDLSRSLPFWLAIR